GRWLATPCRAFRWPKWPQVAAFWAFFTWPFSANYDVQAIYDGHVRVRRPLSSAGVKKPGKCGGKRSVVGGTRENPEKSGEISRKMGKNDPRRRPRRICSTGRSRGCGACSRGGHH